MRAPEGGFARAAHADQHHKAQLRDPELARHAGAPEAPARGLPGSRVPASRLAALSSSPIAPLSAPPPPCHPGADDPLPDPAPPCRGLLLKTAICVDGPTSGSSAPTGR